MFRFATSHNRWPHFALALLVLLFATAAAPAEDAPMPITITADTATLSRVDEVSTYTGNVVLKRGGITLTGAKLVVERLPESSFRATLTGHPATLKRIPPAADAQPLNGHADRIIYIAAEAQIVLRGDAVVERSGDVIRSAIIRHDLEARRTVAEAAPQGDGRVEITLHPDSDVNRAP